MSHRVRRAVVQDVPDLAALAATTFPLACPPGSTRADQQAFIDAALSPACFTAYLADPARTVLVAQDDAAPGTLLGYTMLVAGEPTDPEVLAAVRLHPTIELSKCYVLPGHHGQGLATALLTATLDVARRTGAAGIWLGVNQHNRRAQAFYQRSGFERVGTKHFRVGTRLEDDFVLERTL